MPNPAKQDFPRRQRNSLREALRNAYYRFLKIRGNPREIALGFALGLLVGMTPAMGLHTAIAVFLAVLFQWNKISAAVGVWITNPVTAPVIYGITYFVGDAIFPAGNAAALRGEMGGAVTIFSLLKQAPGAFMAMTLGGLVIGLPLAAIGYYTSLTAIQKYRDGIKEKLARQKARLSLKARKKSRRVKKRRRS